MAIGDVGRKNWTGGRRLGKFAYMNTCELAGKPSSIVEQLREWWKGSDPDQDYLAGATDLADLERRMRHVDRGQGGPVFVTFNH